MPFYFAKRCHIFVQYVEKDFQASRSDQMCGCINELKDALAVAVVKDVPLFQVYVSLDSQSARCSVEIG